MGVYATKAYKTWREAVLERDNRTCQICKRTDKQLNAHHLIPKNFHLWQHNVDNGLTLCVGCHTLAKYSAHKHPIWFTEWLKKNKKMYYTLVLERLKLNGETFREVKKYKKK